jgi:meso-butanediol dehydrogenase / (S,S)-butanediol dehydrogenase / diacetyl reductase
MSGLSGRVAIVTGAAKERGIGRAIALRLAKDGADVVVADFCKSMTDDDPIWSGLKKRTEEISDLGRKSLAINVNITDEKMVGELIESVRTEFGRLDILCNNAGTAAGLNLSYMLSPTEWRNNIEVNLNGTFIMSRVAAQWMVKQKQGGCIINTASWRGFAPSSFMAAYCAAKAGVISLTQVMALELSSHNIRVNAICPGKVDTDMERWAWDMKASVGGKKVEQIMEEEKKKIPLGRIATPDDVAGLVAFIASDEGSYITRQAIPYTGGMILVHP